MSGQHTPGPWALHIFRSNGGFAEIRAQNGSLIADVCCSQRGPDLTPEHEANARLICAAPDLRDALKACAEQLAHCLGPDTEAGRKAQAALAKLEPDACGIVGCKGESVRTFTNIDPDGGFVDLCAQHVGEYETRTGVFARPKAGGR